MTKAKRITVLSVVAVLVIALIAAVAHARTMRHIQRCQGVEIVMDTTGQQLLRTADVRKFIADRHLDPTGQLCDSVDLAHIESELATMPLVDNAECCLLRNGTLHIVVTPCLPFFRVRTAVSDYCIDVNGHQMVTPPMLPDSVICVTGDVTIGFATDRLYPLICFLYSDTAFSNEFRTISVGGGNQVRLYSNRHPYHLIIAGNDRFEPAFEKFTIFRRSAKSNGYETKYQSINLQFRGQIVCKKR